MSYLASYARYVQTRLGCYDKQLGEHSLEQRILEGIETDDVQERRTFLIDVDVVRGSVFAKNKPRHGWSQAVFWGVLRSIFAPFFWDYWSAHLSIRWAAYVMFHFALQFIQVLCFLLIDPNTSKGSQDDVIVPFMLALGLGILHCHITSAHGGLTSSSTQPNSTAVSSGGEAEKRTSFNSETPEKDPSAKMARRTSTEYQHSSRQCCYDAENSTACSIPPLKSVEFEASGTSSPSDDLVQPHFEGKVDVRCESVGPAIMPVSEKRSMKSNVLSPYPGRNFSLHQSSTVFAKSMQPTDHTKTHNNFLPSIGDLCHSTACDAYSSIQPFEEKAVTNSLKGIAKSELSKLSWRCPSNDLEKPQYALSANGQSYDDKQGSVRPIVNPYLTGSTLTFCHHQQLLPGTTIRDRSHSIHFPIHDPNSGLNLPNYKAHHASLELKHLSFSCCSLQDNGLLSRLNVLDSRLPHGISHALHYSDPTLSSATSTSPALSNLGPTETCTDTRAAFESVRPFSIGMTVMQDHVRSDADRLQRAHPEDCSCRTVLYTDPLKSCFSLVKNKSKSVLSKSMASLLCLPTASTALEVGTLLLTGEKMTSSLPTDSIPTDSTSHRIQDPAVDQPSDQNNNEATCPETEDSGIAFNGPRCTTFPPGSTRLLHLRDHSRGPHLKRMHNSAHPNPLVFRRWSPESDTEQDQPYNGFAPPRSRRTNDYSRTVESGYHASVNYRTSTQPRRPRRSQGRITSETECDRLDSDVGASDVDSSSGPDELDPIPSTTQTTQACTQVAPSSRSDSCHANPSKHIPSSKPSTKGKQGHRTYKRMGHATARINTRHTEEEESDSTDSNPSENENGWADQDASTDSERSSPVDQCQQKQQQCRLQPNVSNAEDASRTLNFDFTSIPWTHDPAPTSRPQHTAKLLHKPSLQDAVSKSMVNQPCSLMDTVRCFVWDGESHSKINLTVLDIGYTVIRAVERQGISADYIILASVMTVVLPLLSVTFHWTAMLPPTKLNSTTFPLESSNGSYLLNCYSSPNMTWSAFSDSVLGMHLCVMLRLSERILAIIGPPFRWLWSLFIPVPGSLISTLRYVIQGRWVLDLLRKPDLPGRLVILFGLILRANVYGSILFLLCIAEMTFQQRLLYAKYFFSLTSARRARKYRVPQFRLNKLGHIKCWLTLRSYLKKRGPQRSVETVIAAAFYIVFFFGMGLCSQLISHKEGSVFSHLTNWDILGLTMAIILFLHRFIILGTKITKKYRNFSIVITEQINLYLSMEKKPQKKEELMATFQVLRLVEGLLKEVDGPFRVCGWTVNPLVYNIFKLVLLSCFSSLLSETLGFKLKLYKLKLNAANW